MRPKNLDKDTISRIQELVVVSFCGRDRLYAAVKQLDKEDAAEVCRHLAEHLADHTAELQQILAATGADVQQPLDIDSLVEALFEAIRAESGVAGVLDAAQKQERDLKQEYDRTIDQTPDPELRDTLRIHRDQVEFGERVLRSINPPPADPKGQSDE